ncbi:SLC13 family permease [Halobacillus sp. HZG1]|uniref:GntP family permease n=1 Tax=Halobacillus sp. HZG1 TaxID=3111769 RepID=UPI002DC0045E|nr:SLC13 family permease [Halobacillus sp. HZG1]MEC3883372.1 SLC13 family permease [Halobacillus sp. HZG1]
MNSEVSILGVLVAMAVTILLIFRRINPTYAMMAGAFTGGMVGGIEVAATLDYMLEGAQLLTPAVLRILAAGILVGVLIESGAANVIANTIVEKMGETRALLAITVSTLVLTAVGVFIAAAVITVAPIALMIAKRTEVSRLSILLAVVCGARAGNLMSPNPNTIAASESFSIPLTEVMFAGLGPAAVGAIFTYFIAKKVNDKGSKVKEIKEERAVEENQPTFLAAISGPIFAIGILSLQPLLDIKVDSLLALPAGGLFGVMVMRKTKKMKSYMSSGLEKMSGISILILGTGTLAGIIVNSSLNQIIMSGLNTFQLPISLIAPLSGSFMSLATASATSSVAISSNVFGEVLLENGVSALAGAMMINAGAVAFDFLPHGPLFHISRDSFYMDMKERIKALPYEALIGILLVLVSTIIYGGLF